ncbi:hypothetical protein [Fictibacillus phosphorivorans]|uniref:hypothetical protein n=1 Tax=Fictibacillus phosphorivorans TaxID=1221500 RepID=UPI00204043D3|nr:hypothetical protein [Fictibacillus phosphorivorans]MCM3718068.1 hypothetical protein [Fictibacillus phosphorivorans]MCM3775695.1 hypothetical protein [Fictibacillus phosphorivorans]
MRKILLWALLFVFAGTSLVPNYNMKNLSSSNDEFDFSSVESFDSSNIIGEYPTKSKKLKKSQMAIQLNNKQMETKLPVAHFQPYSERTHKDAIFLTPYQFESNYL